MLVATLPMAGSGRPIDFYERAVVEWLRTRSQL